MSLSFVSVPMFGCIRRMMIGFVLVFEYFVRGSVPPYPWTTLLAVVLVCTGAMVAAWQDLHGSAIGNGLALASIVSAAGYLVGLASVKHRSPDTSYLAILRYNFAIATCLLCVVLAAERESQLVPAMQRLSECGAPCYNALATSSILVVLLNYSMFLSVTLTSPLTTTITGNVKALLTDLVGAAVFADVTLTSGFASGVCLTLLGITTYSYVKWRTSEHLPAAIEAQASGSGINGASAAALPRPVSIQNLYGIAADDV